MGHPLFSIIVPIYKVEKYLCQCIDSIIGQTYKNIEIILIDDGSPDGCPMICDNYAIKDARVKVIHQLNAGLACARNAGLAIASGEYIICIDSDDYYCDSQLFEQFVSIIDESPNVDVIWFGFKKYFESSKTFNAPKWNYPEFSNMATPAGALTLLLERDLCFSMTWNKVIKRQFLTKYNICFRPGLISEDIDWFYHVAMHARIHRCINRIGLVYRQRQNSISHSPSIKSLQDNLWIFETWLRRIKEESISDDMKKVLYAINARIYANTLILYSSYDKKTRKEYYPKIKSFAWILKYSVTKRAKVIKWFSKLLGLKLTCLILNILYKIRTRV